MFKLIADHYLGICAFLLLAAELAGLAWFCSSATSEWKPEPPRHVKSAWCRCLNRLRNGRCECRSHAVSKDRGYDRPDYLNR
jgi:hypothetical protein